MDTDTFIVAAREWCALLRDVGEAFVVRYLDLAMQLAVALHCQNDADAERAVNGVSSADQRDLLALSAILRLLLEAATREHMTFLLPAAQRNEMAQSSLRKAEQTIVQSLPEAFRPRFRQMLAKYWDTLNETAESATFSLPRVDQLHWKVAKDSGQRILLRLQTSDGRTRTIHVPIKQFHQLRHSAASVLQEMNQVEAHPMMRLAYLEQSRRTEAVVMTTGSGTTSSVP
ncbi:hypothetical protein JG687_00015219 [Phytophthora cactorum]|uniref:Uncharacterized protein n=1 Tax=Phytophthora cactorum TaxID=29920 RepID=A0A329S695_9STRA|nr:HCaRG [Phytophthora cactorum]KAG2769124.1 hypothetical protein Pcac1_g19555 [Phytophthora cactorum]KAG2799961.1 hypothetical protein PC111_g20187 [Phytophthora cactorum]KAG2802003.1 hypothetical protein PC112_g19812 [Phytophthora cactorum]KAG2838653.1 hypothetical protein PC113_g19628 [Phytophthora cactorum]